MSKTKNAKKEKRRVDALKEYSILDTMPEKEYDDITYLASQICGTPISLVSMVDDQRQWFKSKKGLEVKETSRDIAFCAHAIQDKDNIFIVSDAHKDERFKDNPLVKGDPHIAFYAGVPLVNPEGFPLGTLCVIDRKPRKLSEDQIKSLKALSNLILKLLESRRENTKRKTLNYEMRERNNALNNFVKIAAHDIKSPLNNIQALTAMLQKEHSKNIDEDGKEIVEFINKSITKLKQLVEGILKFSKDTNVLSKNKESINLKELVIEVSELVEGTREVNWIIDVEEEMVIYSNKIAIEQILINLYSNSIKYNDKDRTEIIINGEKNDEGVRLKISDNGPGIDKKDRERIFNLFETTINTDKEGKRGLGIGLATVKSLIEGLGGEIDVNSILGKGTDFTFYIPG